MASRKFTKIKKENPETSIWYEVTDMRTNVTSKCVQHMYHTNQRIHLQGGQRIGKVTTTSIVADFLEKEWAEIIEANGTVIKHNAEAIKNINIKQFEEELKQNTTSEKENVNHEYDLCKYESTYEYQMKRHMYMKHEIKLEMKRKMNNKTVTFKPATPEIERVKYIEKNEDKSNIEQKDNIPKCPESPPSKRTKESDNVK